MDTRILRAKETKEELRRKISSARDVNSREFRRALKTGGLPRLQPSGNGASGISCSFIITRELDDMIEAMVTKNGSASRSAEVRAAILERAMRVLGEQ